MKGQFSRLTARRAQHYSSVRLQQGRVQLDADFNEQVDIALRRAQLTTLDVVGPSGVPEGAPGFALSPIVSLLGLDVAGSAFRAVGGRGAVVASADTGATWAMQAVPAGAAEHDLGGVSVLDATTALAVSAAGDVLLQTDGTTWVAKASPSASARPRAVALLSATTAWVVGDGGLIAGTTNAAGAWTTAVAAGVTESLRAVHFPTANAGWAVGDGGRIVATANAGAAWAAQTAPAGVVAGLRAVRFAADALHGWAAGDGATILATVDGGAHWTVQAPPVGVDATLRGLSVVDASTAWAVGDRGTVLRTADGGATWSLVAADAAWSSADLRAVHAAAGDSALVAGDQSVLASVKVTGGVPAWQASPALAGRDLGIAPGRLYVDGIGVENDAPSRYLAQPSLPGASVPAAGTYRAYLDVWTRHLTALDRPELREVALGGPDTATRTQTVWQVRLETPALTGSPTCASLPAGWRPGDVSDARLRARGAPAPVSSDDCLVPSGGGYRRLENLLYRVEVHTPGAAGTATYKWSRDNGSIVARLTASDTAAGTVTVDDPGHNPGGDFAGAAWVELTDDARLLAGQPGRLLAVQGVTGPVIQLAPIAAPATQPTMADFGEGARVRRWDGTGTVTAGTWIALAASGAAIATDGVEVEFAGNAFVSGDYWTLPARTLTGEVEWPVIDGTPQYVARDGDEHHYSQLGLVSIAANGGITVASDCRVPFAPLAGLETLVYVAGDGQEVLGGGALTLPDQAVVAVTRGPIPVPGATVRFTVADGGTVNAASTVDLTTVADGTARATWVLANAVSPQHLTAELIDASGARRGVPITFQARVRSAASISYDPTCADLVGATTVQAAIDALCARPTGGGGCCHLVGKDATRAGEFGDLAEALKEYILGRKEGDVCICLLPGDYRLDPGFLSEVVKKAGGLDRLLIRGPGARLDLGVEPISGVAHLVLEDLELLATDGVAAVFADTTDTVASARMAVDLTGVTAHVTGAPSGAAVITFETCGVVRVRDCFLTTVGRQVSKVRELMPTELGSFLDQVDAADAPALHQAYAALIGLPLDVRRTEAKQLLTAVDKNPNELAGDIGSVAKRFAEALAVDNPQIPTAAALAKQRISWGPLLKAIAGSATIPSAVAFRTPSINVSLGGNRIIGGISLVGTGRNAPAELAIEKVLRPHTLAPAWTGIGRLAVDGNALDWIALGADAAIRLAETGGDAVTAEVAPFSFAEVLLTNNTFRAAPQAIVGEVVALNGNLMERAVAPFPGAPGARLGFVASVAATATGNVGPSRANRGTDPLAELVLDGADRADAGNARLAVV